MPPREARWAVRVRPGPPAAVEVGEMRRNLRRCGGSSLCRIYIVLYVGGVLAGVEEFNVERGGGSGVVLYSLWH